MKYVIDGKRTQYYIVRQGERGESGKDGKDGKDGSSIVSIEPLSENEKWKCL